MILCGDMKEGQDCCTELLIHGKGDGDNTQKDGQHSGNTNCHFSELRSRSSSISPIVKSFCVQYSGIIHRADGIYQLIAVHNTYSSLTRQLCSALRVR